MPTETAATPLNEVAGEVADLRSDVHEQIQLVRESVTRLRPYVPGKPIDEVKRELGLPADMPIVKLASNENVLGPSPRAVEASTLR